MNWPLSILIGFVTAAVGCLGSGFVAIKCVRWYRISSFEGLAGFYVVAIALCGLIGGFFVGVICSRMVAASQSPGFLKGLSIAMASTGALVLMAGVIAWLNADLEPEIDGCALELAIEVRCPKDFTMPKEPDEYGAFATVYVPGGRHSPQGELRLQEVKQVDGRCIVPATVPLATSSSRKYLRAYFHRDADVTFPLPLPSHPRKSDLEWSTWVESGWDVGTPEPPPDGKFNLRYRVQLVEPPPPGPSATEIAAREAAEDEAQFAAVNPDAPIADWLPYTRYGVPDSRRQIAIGHITAKANYVAELSGLMLSDDAQIAAQALYLIEHLPQPRVQLLDSVTAAGRDIAARIRKVNDTTVEQDPSYLGAADVAVRFSAWMVAVRTLRAKSGGDFTPELGVLLELSRVRDDSLVMRGDVLRVASYYMQQWAGVAPLPTDPKPR